MSLENVVASIDSEIASLEKVRKLLAGSGVKTSTKPRRAISAATRKKIAAAQRRRWAAVRKAAN
jgi:hypothetical protein